jgi:peroxiredoxin
MTDPSVETDRAAAGQPGSHRLLTTVLRIALSLIVVASVGVSVHWLTKPDTPAAPAAMSAVADEEPAEMASLGPVDAGPPRVGEPAPDFALMSTDGQPVRLSELRGRAVLLNFWATWCGPCKVELPDFDSVYRSQRESDFTVLAVNFQESRKEARTYMAENNLDLPTLLDARGEVAQAYRVAGLPATFFIDRDGIVREVNLGLVTRDQLVKKLTAIGVTVAAGVLKD